MQPFFCQLKKFVFFFAMAWAALLPAQTNYCADRFTCQCNSFQSYKDVVYRTATNYTGAQQQLKMDIYVPDDLAPYQRRPLIVFIHGGAFIAGNKTDFAPGCQAYVKNGFVTATIQYRLGFDGSSNPCNPTAWPNAVLAVYRALQDARSAINFLVDNAAQYKVDPDNIIIVGYSAGAVTALHLAYASQQELDAYNDNMTKTLGPLPPPKGTLKGVISLAGFLVKPEMLDTTDRIPLLLCHGTCDIVVGYSNTNALPYCGNSLPVVAGSLPLAAQAAKNKQNFQFVTFCGHGHDLLPTINDNIYCTGLNFIYHRVLCGNTGQTVESYVLNGDQAACAFCQPPPPVPTLPLPTAVCAPACKAGLCTLSAGETPLLSNILRLYPNPATSSVLLDLPEGTVVRAVTAVSVAGQQVPLQFNGQSVTVQHLPQGWYTLLVDTGKTVLNGYFIKQ